MTLDEIAERARYRYEVRLVDVVRRAYVFMHSEPRYADAVFEADVYISMCPDDFVVWDSVERKVLYDSREIRKKVAA